MPAPRANRPSKDELHRLIHVEKFTYYQIGEIYGVAFNTVGYWVAQHGITSLNRFDRAWGDQPVPTQDELKQLYESGVRTEALAQRFNVGKHTIKNLLRKYKIILRKPGFQPKREEPIDIDRIRELYDTGTSLESIAQQLGYTATHIWRIAKDAGIEMRLCGFNGGRRYTCKNGEIVLSVYEQRVCDWFVDNGIAYIYEPTLPWGHRSRADFLVNGWYIEVWGVSDKHYQPYLIRRRRKERLYRLHGLPLIGIPRKAFYQDNGRLERLLNQCRRSPRSEDRATIKGSMVQKELF